VRGTETTVEEGSCRESLGYSNLDWRI
jgi:hypothetical protein